MNKIGNRQEHVLARADYFRGRATKTSDPVYWDECDILEALTALAAVGDRFRRKYENALAAIEAALHKASH